MTLDSTLLAIADETAFSGAVRVSANGHVVAEFARGLADRDAQLANTTVTRFATASGTKLFTALVVGTLIDEGSVTLETRLSESLQTPLPNVAPDVTIGHLLGHTSGVYDYYDEELVDDFDNFELPIAPESLIRLADYRPMLEAGPMKFDPGTRLSYSNSGYIILGLAIESLLGVPFAEAVRERVFSPAAMSHSGFFRFDDLPPQTARGYVESQNGFHTNAKLLPMVGGADGGAFTTTADMERLWTALFAGRLLSAELVATFSRRHRESKPGIHYGSTLR